MTPIKYWDELDEDLRRCCTWQMTSSVVIPNNEVHLYQFYGDPDELIIEYPEVQPENTPVGFRLAVKYYFLPRNGRYGRFLEVVKHVTQHNHTRALDRKARHRKLSLVHASQTDFERDCLKGFPPGIRKALPGRTPSHADRVFTAKLYLEEKKRRQRRNA